MARRYRNRRKSKNMLVPAMLLLLLITSVAFVFAIRLLISPSSEQVVAPEITEEQQHEEFIQKLVVHAQELQDGYGVLPSIIIGQAILESNWGQSLLASEYKNLFGIKAYGSQKKVNLETQEYVNEEWITIQGDFRVYDSWEDSMDDHTMLFVNGVNWDPLLYEKVLTAEKYADAAKALQEAGYATDPDYADKIISVIETYNLDQYDQR